VHTLTVQRRFVTQKVNGYCNLSQPTENTRKGERGDKIKGKLRLKQVQNRQHEINQPTSGSDYIREKRARQRCMEMTRIAQNKSLKSLHLEYEQDKPPMEQRGYILRILSHCVCVCVCVWVCVCVCVCVCAQDLHSERGL
jgi:hypothetical protein